MPATSPLPQTLSLEPVPCWGERRPLASATYRLLLSCAGPEVGGGAGPGSPELLRVQAPADGRAGPGPVWGGASRPPSLALRLGAPLRLEARQSWGWCRPCALTMMGGGNAGDLVPAPQFTEGETCPESQSDSLKATQPRQARAWVPAPRSVSTCLLDACHVVLCPAPRLHLGAGCPAWGSRATEEASAVLSPRPQTWGGPEEGVPR